MGFGGFGFKSAQGGISGFQPAQGAATDTPGNPELQVGLQWYFKFDSATGLFTDSKTSTVLTTTNSPTTETGIIAQAMGVNDTDESRASSTASALLTAASEVNTPSEESTNVAYPFTVMGWFYSEVRSGPDNTGGWIVEECALGHNWLLMYYRAQLDPTAFLFGIKGNGSYVRTTTLATDQAQDEWHCICFQSYGSNMNSSGVFTPHQNAKRIMLITGSAGSGAIAQNVVQTCCNETLQAGTELKFCNAPNGDVNGRFDMVARWNRILPESEILLYYNDSKGGSEPIM